jgi:hypothetical protein
MPDDDEALLQAAREREALEEWLRANRAENARRDLTDAAPQTNKGTASETQIEALDRAAHTPAFHQQEPLFSAEDEKRLGERARDYAELYPTPEAWDRSFPPLAPPADATARGQYDDLGQFQKEADNVTPEQKARVDKALADVTLTDNISSAAIPGGRPQPNEPTPVEKARDVGQDLQKAGVTMDKE